MKLGQHLEPCQGPAGENYPCPSSPHLLFPPRASAARQRDWFSPRKQTQVNQFPAAKASDLFLCAPRWIPEHKSSPWAGVAAHPQLENCFCLFWGNAAAPQGLMPAEDFK